MRPTPLWQTDVRLPSFPALERDIEADVAVIGAGIAGVTAAMLLQRAGKRVALIEARQVGGGETGHTTAHLTELIDARYHVLESKFGRDGARRARESSRAAIDRIEALAAELAPDCGFERVAEYLYAETDAQRRELENELASLQRAGSSASWVEQVPLPLAIQGAVRLDQQGRFHPLAYLRGLLARFVADGGEVFERTAMLDVDEAQPCRVRTSGGTITARDVLVLAHVPVINRLALHTKLAAYRSYAIAAPLREPFPDANFSDMQDPYHYIRSQQTAAGTVLIVGGEDHKTGKHDDTRQCFERLAQYASAHFPIGEISHRWSGQIIEPADGLPFIGKNTGADHVYVGTGFSGEGMTFGTLAAMLLSDAVLEVKNPWAALYDATRVKPLAQARKVLSEGADFPAHIAHDRITGGEVETPEQVPAGEGRLVREQGKMLAVYRDDGGALHARSAVCTHLGCYVHWNRAERSWDCPCHGSRFDIDGAVLNGPAIKPLAQPGAADEPTTVPVETAALQGAK